MDVRLTHYKAHYKAHYKKLSMVSPIQKIVQVVCTNVISVLFKKKKSISKWMLL